MIRILIDTSIIVGYLDGRDNQHGKAVELLGALADPRFELVILDCVAVEAVGVLCRRRRERKQKTDLPSFALFTNERLTRAYDLLPRHWSGILERVTGSDGVLNAHDCL